MQHLKLFENFLDNDDEREIVYHGSPRKFNSFVGHLFGSGEGASGFGQGLYFSEDKDDADDYARKLSRDEIGYVYTVAIPNRSYFLDLDERAEDQSDYVKACLLKIPRKYLIELAEPQYSREVAKNEQEIADGEIEEEDANQILEEWLQETLEREGIGFYHRIEEVTGGEYQAARLLRKIGIKGNMHTGFGYLHFVVFDEEDIELLEREIRGAEEEDEEDY